MRCRTSTQSSHQKEHKFLRTARFSTSFWLAFSDTIWALYHTQEARLVGLNTSQARTGRQREEGGVSDGRLR